MHIYSAYKELKDRGSNFLTADQNSPLKSYTEKVSDVLKFSTRFLNDVNKGFLSECVNKFDR